MARLSELGERRIIEDLRRILKGVPPLDLEDDCAAVPLGNRYLLVTTDVVNRATHIPKGATPRQVGWYTAAVNLSDIAAKGGRPLGLAVAMTLPRDLDEGYVRQIALGLRWCCRAFGTQVLAGDTKEGPDISLAGVALGMTKGKRLLARRGAHVGDIVGVTGTLGRAGWAYLHRDVPAGIKGLMEPKPRIPEGLLLAASRASTSCMDISDGLAASLHQMALLTGLNFEVTFQQLPLFAPLRREPPPARREASLFMGGDYELLFTASSKGWPRLQEAFQREGLRATAIGAVGEGEENVLLTSHGREPLPGRGWEHFT